MKARILAIVLGLVVLATLVSVAKPVSAIHWCSPSTLYFSPTQGYSGDADPFTFTLTDNIADALNVQSFTVTYSWISTGVNLGSGSMAGYASYTWHDTESLPSPGSYTISVAVSGKAVGDLYYETCTYGPYTFTSQSLPPPPTVVATANPTTGLVPLTVSFTATVSQGLGPFSFSWSFGDGQSDSGQSVSHTYSSAGTFTAQVIVTDSRGRSASDTASITVTPSTGGGTNPPGSGPVNPSGVDLGPWIALAVVVVIAVAIVAVMLARRSRRTPPPPPPGPAQPPLRQT